MLSKEETMDAMSEILHKLQIIGQYRFDLLWAWSVRLR